MRHPAAVALLCALVGVAGSVPAAGQQTAPDDAAVRKLIADFSAANDRADADAYGALHVNDAYVIDGGVVLIGRQALIERFKADVAGPFKGMKFVSHKVEQLRYPAPTLAFGTTTWEVTVPNQPNVKGTALFLATKRGGRWLFEGWYAAPSQP